MSRGFVREGDQEEVPFVPPRAFLPNGVTNYVTANGLEELKKEQETLLEERSRLKEEAPERNRVQINYITAKLDLLIDRINSAKVIDLSDQPKDTVLFGTTVSLHKEEEDCNCQYQIVGADEANVSLNKISFLSPIAKVLLNKKVGEQITLKTPNGIRHMKIVAIEYTDSLSDGKSLLSQQ